MGSGLALRRSFEKTPLAPARAGAIATAMALTTIVCPRCAHCGHVAANSLPRMLRCHACGHAELCRQGRQMIRARYIEDDDREVADRVVDDSPRCAAAYACTAPPPAAETKAHATSARDRGCLTIDDN